MVNNFKREYPERPIIGVGGIIFDDNSVLLVKRAQAPGTGKWSLPGGAVELGETLVDALNREVYEEVSIKIEIGGLVRLLDRILYDRENRIRFHYVIADYWGRLVSGRPKAASDVSDARFVAIDQAQKMGIDKEVEETIFMGLKMRGDG
ncbi:NUDIX hydrolase [Thermodesulfobacteriota bacterium]